MTLRLVLMANFIRSNCSSVIHNEKEYSSHTVRFFTHVYSILILIVVQIKAHIIHTRFDLIYIDFLKIQTETELTFFVSFQNFLNQNWFKRKKTDSN